MTYEAIIGLEIHAQLLTRSKIFCNCSTRFGAAPNSQVCPICLGYPGVLPVLNRTVVEYAIKAALAMNCRINEWCRFDRKNYFYPDLPKAYQISQFASPLAEHGFIEIVGDDGQVKKIGIIRIHMEEDAGKLVHAEEYVSANKSYVDFNRTGVPLIEIVSEPDLRSPKEARDFLQKLRSIVQYLEVCDGNMEEGSLRCDANVSVRPEGTLKFGTKVEIKNLNSFRFLQKALEYEVQRQIRLLESGERIVQETRLWDAEQNRTISMRSKEEAHDYRYFPEPDLVPLHITPEWVEKLRASLPELPDAKVERFIRDYQLPRYDAELLSASRSLADYYEQCVALFPHPKVVSNWVMGELLRELNNRNIDASASPLSPKALADLLKMVEQGIISNKIAKSLFDEMFDSGKPAELIVRERGLVQISDETELEKIVDSVLAENPLVVEDLKRGKKQALGFLVGQVMKATSGKANPAMVNGILRRKLGVDPL
ncbi:MAG: Asp-tRNA(Asn)/Glu-tRNA(Gln) amidotransferase subunit GatB [bacterium]|nr:Asp-tRNA(Asn)/Glu-tRNA(Gln) amidotransferase subunit GatB [bacterium]